jgi:hypothetical protein
LHILCRKTTPYDIYCEEGWLKKRKNKRCFPERPYCKESSRDHPRNVRGTQMVKTNLKYS